MKTEYILVDYSSEDANFVEPTNMKVTGIGPRLNTYGEVSVNGGVGILHAGPDADGNGINDGIYVCCNYDNPILNTQRVVYTGQDNCWVEYRRDHQPSRMLAVNQVALLIYPPELTYVEGVIVRIATELFNKKWVPSTITDKGAFGKYVSELLIKECHGQFRGWCLNVQINKTTGLVQGFGTGNTPNNCYEIDALRLRGRYWPQVGQPLDLRQVDFAVEFKCSNWAIPIYSG